MAGSCGDILVHEGFREIGRLTHCVALSLWWHEAARVELLALPMGSKTLLRGCKSYFMLSISEAGETYARDINQLHDYLETHFPELHISFSFFRDVPAPLAASHIKCRTKALTPTVAPPTIDALAQLQRRLSQARQDVAGLEGLASMISNDGTDSGLLRNYASGQLAEGRRRVEKLEDQCGQRREEVQRFKHLQREYERKGSAAVFTFSITSNLQLAATPRELRDAVKGIVKELDDLHRFQVSQKLNGGRLSIRIAESDEPAMTWIEQWMGGALSPTQLARLKPDLRVLRKAPPPRVMVSADEDIRVDGAVHEDKKLLAARVASSLMQRLDKTNAAIRDKAIPASALPLRVGRLIVGDHGIGRDEYVLPLHGANHIYASGTTGSGKSYLGRVIVEEAARLKGLNILVLDPRNQSAGLLVAEDRPAVLGLYERFGMRPDKTRGFSFEYRSPGQQTGKPLPKDLRSLGRGRHIISFKGMDDEARCSSFADILDGVFDCHAESEVDTTRQLIVIEEAHRFTKKGVDESARKAATRAENALDRMAREGRKFGMCVLILSQTIRDFAYDSASIRQNTNTKVFMHNADREVEYAADFIGDGKQIIQLQTGEAIICHPAIGTARIRTRPPYSKVWEFSGEETRRLVDDPGAASRTVSGNARALLSTITELHAARGEGINVTELCDHLGISSKRRIQSLLAELERAGLVTSRHLRARGNPRVIEPIVSTSRTRPRTGAGPNTDGSAHESGDLEAV